MLAIPKVLPVAMQPAAPLAKANPAEEASFAKQMAETLSDVNKMQLRADQLTQQLVLGEIEDLHHVTIAMEEAKLSLQLAVQVRNKIIEAYQEIARMQV
jgi:flagellar hook-basal body complex protein FliE